jgi:hypothetical protein
MTVDFMSTSSELATALAKYNADTAQLEAALADLAAAGDAEFLREAARAIELVSKISERVAELPPELREADAAAWAEREPEIRTAVAAIRRGVTNLSVLRLSGRAPKPGHRRVHIRSARRRPVRRTRRAPRGSPARSTDDDPPPSPPHRWEKTSIGGIGFDDGYHLCVLKGVYHLWEPDRGSRG